LYGWISDEKGLVVSVIFIATLCLEEVILMPLESIAQEASVKTKRVKLGQMMVAEGLISLEQLQKALTEKRNHGGRIGVVLQRLGYVTEKDVAKMLGQQLSVSYYDLSSKDIPADIFSKIPEWLSRKCLVVPVEMKNEEVTVAMADPKNYESINDLRFYVGMAIKPVIATRKQILEKIDQFYGIDSSAVTEIVEASAQEFDLNAMQVLPEVTDPMETSSLEKSSRLKPIIQLANMILSKAIKVGASDIHIEPSDRECRVRFRIDGVLQEDMKLPNQVEKALISRIKILTSLDISERRLPQDGSIRVYIAGKEIDLRVSTLPTLYGEKVVIRLLDQSKVSLSLKKAGFPDESLRQFNTMIHRSYGLILVTGPTGSGKTTTLYSALKQIDSVGKNIVTIEDPVEYRIKTINQVQINQKLGLSFASGLRSILRQDPDIVMIGEIRDRETAVIAIQAALTGHLVLATLHTNDAAGAITRLVDMGVEPFLIASALLGVVAQRLIRKICPHCKEPASLEAAQLTVLSENNLLSEGLLPHFMTGRGCSECWESGYAGRTGIFELLVADEQIRKLIGMSAPTSEIRRKAAAQGFRSLRTEALSKALEGITSLEEVFRLTQECDGDN